jgi:hypothetical protein
LYDVIDMEGLAFFGQYLDGQIDQRLTPSPTPGLKDRLGFRFSSELSDSPQLIFELKFEHLKKDFLEFFSFHRRLLLWEIG